MTRVFERETFSDFYDQDSGSLFRDLEFRRCQFIGSSISITRDPRLRSTVRNMRFIGCEQRGCAVDAGIIEDVVVDALKTNGLFQTWGTVFKHVTLRGKIERVMLSPAVSAGLASVEQQRAFDEANATYYEHVDWALDISEGEFQECELQRIPAHLVRRDAESQVVVKREKAMRGEWRKLDLSTTHWDISLEDLLRRGDADVVLVAPKRSRKYGHLLDGLKLLRDAGVAEPG